MDVRNLRRSQGSVWQDLLKNGPQCPLTLGCLECETPSNILTPQGVWTPTPITVHPLPVRSYLLHGQGTAVHSALGRAWGHVGAGAS